MTPEAFLGWLAIITIVASCALFLIAVHIVRRFDR